MSVILLSNDADNNQNYIVLPAKTTKPAHDQPHEEKAARILSRAMANLFARPNLVPIHS
jgi:hypothetical protein